MIQIQQDLRNKMAEFKIVARNFRAERRKDYQIYRIGENTPLAVADSLEILASKILRSTGIKPGLGSYITTIPSTDPLRMKVGNEFMVEPLTPKELFDFTF